MVSRYTTWWRQATERPLALCVLAAAEGQSLLQRLTPLVRMRVVLALLGLVLLAVAGITLVWMTGRYWRSQIRKPLPPVKPREDEWARKPLASDKPPVSDKLR